MKKIRACWHCIVDEMKKNYKVMESENGMGVVEVILIIVEYYLSPISMYIVYKDIFLLSYLVFCISYPSINPSYQSASIKKGIPYVYYKRITSH